MLRGRRSVLVGAPGPQHLHGREHQFIEQFFIGLRVTWGASSAAGAALGILPPAHATRAERIREQLFAVPETPDLVGQCHEACA